MCCRYVMFLKGQAETAVEQMNGSELTRYVSDQLKKPVKTHGEIRPTDLTAVYAMNKKGVPGLFSMVWGYTPSVGKSLIFNARSETAGEKPMFRDGWLSHRCVIPAACYYEWAHRKEGSSTKGSGTKYSVRSADEENLWLCGLYRMEGKIPHFVILTRDASESIRFLHDRMPVILPREKVREWISPSGNPEELLAYARNDMHAQSGEVVQN